MTVGPASPTAIIYASLDHPNDKLVALLFAAEALRRGGCKRIVLLSPYLCYMRQDVSFREGEAISQRAVGRLLAGIADRIITVDAHLHRTHELAMVLPGIEAVNLSAMPVIAETLRTEGIDPATVIIGPDAEFAAVGPRSRGPDRSQPYSCAKGAPRRSFGRNQF